MANAILSDRRDKNVGILCSKHWRSQSVYTCQIEAHQEDHETIEVSLAKLQVVINS